MQRKTCHQCPEAVPTYKTAQLFRTNRKGTRDRRVTSQENREAHSKTKGRQREHAAAGLKLLKAGSGV